jgi:uncharacterized membrane protein YciS (DUF1049 family)
MYFFLLLALFIAIAAVLFAIQNATIVTVTFLSLHFEGSLAFILVVVFASGLVAGMLMTLPSILRKNLTFREQKKKVKKLEEEMSEKLTAQSENYRDEDNDNPEV